MKKTTKKLGLARESLHNLSDGGLNHVAGGALPNTAHLASCGGGCQTKAIASCLVFCTKGP